MPAHMHMPSAKCPCVHAHAHTHAHTHTHTCTHTHTHAHAHAHTHTCTHTHVQVLSMPLHMHMHTCTIRTCVQVLSMPLAEWMIEQPHVNHFVARAHERSPPAWDIGEDTVLGMWVHSSPFAITAMHWGWDKVHDLCFKCTDRKQLWKPITDLSVVIHIKGHQVTSLT